MQLPGWAAARVEALWTNRRTVAIGLAIYALAALAFRWGRRGAGSWGMDDAAITFAAAFELADHGSLAPYPEGTPVESYSNPLVFFVVAFLRWVGVFDPVTTHVQLEMLLFAFMVTMVWSMLRPWTGELAAAAAALVFVALELLTPATWLWYGSGLENVWVATGLVTLLWLVTRTARGIALAPGWGAVAFLVAITRPEAPVYVAAFYGAAAIVGRPPGAPIRAHARQVLRALAVTAVLYLLFMAWRWIAYQDVWPNTYYAKLPDEVSAARNFRTYVVGEILPYCRAGLFAAMVIGLLLVPAYERLAPTLLVFLVASLTLPITAGRDWMGEHRFATSFLAMAHVTYAALVAACIARLSRTAPRTWRLVDGVTLAAVLGLALLLRYDKLAVVRAVPFEGDRNVTIGWVGRVHGADRWELQMRAGVPNAVVVMPDAGGSLLVGGFQLLDSGFLTDFQMPRLSRRFAEPAAKRELDRYQNAERRPDLVNPSPHFPFVHERMGSEYLVVDELHAVRRDLSLVEAIDPRAKLLYEDARVRVFLSPETVRAAGRGGLLRCELVAEWLAPSEFGTLRIRATIDGGDRDERPLQPLEPARAGAERIGLLLGMPPRDGAYPVTIEVLRDETSLARAAAFTAEVTTRDDALGRAASELRAGASPDEVMRRVAWLREQQPRRLPMVEYRRAVQSLEHADRLRSGRAGQLLLRLRDNARLASLGSVPRSIRAAEADAIRGLFATCAAAGADEESRARRTLCLGRAVYELRRHGYLGVLGRAPDVRAELGRARDQHVRFAMGPRYLSVLGRSLADPSDVGLQRQLLRLRRELARADALPAVD